MNIFNKIALQGLRKNRTRTIVTIIGVILSSLLITGVTTFGVSLLDYMVNGAIQRYGEWTAAFLDTDTSFVQERMRDEEVRDTRIFQNIGYAVLEGGQNPNKPYLYIAGFQEDTFDALHITMVAGRLPENDREILVSARAASEGGISHELGDMLSLSVGSRMKGEQELTQASPYISGEEAFLPGEEKTYTVVGICRTPVFETEEAPGYTLITRANAADSSRSLSLFITLENASKVYSYVDKVKDGHAYILNYDVLRIMGISDHPSDKVFMAFLYSFGGIVLAIIMIGSIFLIYNSFSISLNERMREIGVLASVGATSRQLRNSVLFEGLCIGAIGIPIGILAGLGGISLVLSAVSGNFSAILFTGVPLAMKVSVFSIAGAAAVSIVTILISAYLPARKAVRMPVMECIRQTNEIKTEARAMEVSRRKQRMYGLEGTLALKNFKRNRKRYRSIVLSLTLSIVLFVSTNAMIISMKQTTGDLKEITDYDIAIGTQEMEDSELLRLYDKLKNVDGIRTSSYRAAVWYSSPVPADVLSDAYWEAMGGHSQEAVVDLPVMVHFFSDDFYRNIVQDLGLPVEEYTGQNGKVIAVAKINDDSEDVKGVKDLADMFQKESMDFRLITQMPNGTEASQRQNISASIIEFVPPDIPPMPLAESGKEAIPYTFEILAPWSMKGQLAPPGLPVDLQVKGLCFESEKPSQSAAEMRDIIAEEEITSSYVMINTAEAFEQARNYMFIANVFAYTFIVLISMIAVANVFNTISTNIRLRRRELAMLRSVGMSDKDFNKMMRFECAFYGMKALAIGIPLSLLLSVLIVKITMTDDTRIVLPWTSIGISILAVFLVIFVTMMYAVSKIRKENIIDALRDEMT